MNLRPAFPRPPRVWSFTADSQFLLIGNDKDQLEIWDWQQQKKDSELFKSRRGMTAVAVTKDNKSVIVGDYEGNIVFNRSKQAARNLLF